MIDDKDIDLTKDNKFNISEYELDKHSNTTARRLFNKVNEFDLLDKYCRTKSHRLPWKKKQSEIHSEYKLLKKVRKYDDPISDEFQRTIRRTWDNTIMQFFGEDKYEMCQEAIDETFFEVLGYLPNYSSILRCWECGRLHIGNANSMPMFCMECRDNYRSRIPWQRI